MRELALDGALDRAGQFCIVGDEDRLRARVMFGLGKKVGGDPVRIAVLVGDDQHFGGPGDHVDADLAEHHALGRRHIGIAGADDLGDRGDALGAVGERRDRLRAADAINLVDAGELRRREHERRQNAVGRRHHHHHPRHAGDLGRHRVHQHRGWIGCGAARHVKPDRFDGGPARPEFDAQRVGEAVILRHLPAVKCLDAVAGEFERVEGFPGARVARRGDLLRLDLETDPVEVDAIEFLRQFLERAVAARGNFGDDGANRRVDVGRCFALGTEKGAKFLGKIAGADVEADRHGVACRRKVTPVNDVCGPFRQHRPAGTFRSGAAVSPGAQQTLWVALKTL